MTREQTVAATKSAFVSIGKGALMAYLYTIPFFALPIIRNITESVVQKLLEVLANAAEMGAFFIYIDFRSNAQGRDFTEKALNYEAAKKTGDPDKIKLAEDELKAAMRALVRFSS